jgi:hypothetical protein
MTHGERGAWFATLQTMTSDSRRVLTLEIHPERRSARWYTNDDTGVPEVAAGARASSFAALDRAAYDHQRMW